MGTITLINGKPVTYLKNNLAADAIYVKSGASFLPAASLATDASGKTTGVTGVNIPVVWSQGGIDIVLAPSGSFAANGVLTLGTALDRTYANCYMYFPANAIYAGSAAGKYYCVMSTTLLGVVYNNTYVSGIPDVPTNLIAFVCTGSGAYTQTTSQIIMHQPTQILANTLGKNGSIQVNHLWTANNNANAKTIYTVLGAATSSAFNIASTIGGNFIDRIINTGLTNNQLNWNHAASFGTSSAGLPNYTAADTTTDLYFTLQAQLATATDYMVLHAGTQITINPLA